MKRDSTVKNERRDIFSKENHFFRRLPGLAHSFFW